MFHTDTLRRALPPAARLSVGAAALFAVAAFLITRSSAAGHAGSFSSAFDAAPTAVPAPQAIGVAAPGVAPGMLVEKEQAAARALSRPLAGMQAAGAADVMMIRNGHVVIEVDSLERAIERVRRLAAGLGGSVGNIATQTGDRQVRSATVEIRVPAPRFDEALTGLSPLGEVEQSSATAQDVGEEYVDITARVANARRLERRLVDLLATRTGRLEDVLAVERELARVREEIERYEGRLRYLGSRAATSTIVASLHEPEPLVASPGANVITDAFRQMWRNFVRLIAAAIESLGVLAPLALVAWVVWRATRRRRDVQASVLPAPAHLRDTPA